MREGVEQKKEKRECGKERTTLRFKERRTERAEVVERG